MRFQSKFCHSTFAAIAGLALAIGCASEKTVPKTVRKAATSANPLAGQARRMRDSEGDLPGTGLSSRSRDIEKNLGYR
jgi:hypothetical protein